MTDYIVIRGFYILFCFFFFQAEDGIRDLYVTGVQTCALPIFRRMHRGARSRLAAIWHPGAYGERTMQGFLKETEATARKLGIELQLVQALYAAEFEYAFSAMIRWNADALIVLPSPMLFAEHRRIVELAAKNRLPAMYQAREFVDAGGLMSYGANLADLNRRAATYVDKILKGTKPADLPVEQPTKFELLVNLKTT